MKTFVSVLILFSLTVSSGCRLLRPHVRVEFGNQMERVDIPELGDTTPSDPGTSESPPPKEEPTPAARMSASGVEASEDNVRRQPQPQKPSSSLVSDSASAPALIDPPASSSAATPGKCSPDCKCEVCGCKNGECLSATGKCPPGCKCHKVASALASTPSASPSSFASDSNSDPARKEQERIAEETSVKPSSASAASVSMSPASSERPSRDDARSKVRCLVFKIENCPKCVELDKQFDKLSTTGWRTTCLESSHFRVLYADDKDEGETLAEQYGVTTFPTMVMVDVKGNPLSLVTGTHSANSLADWYMKSDKFVKSASYKPSWSCVDKQIEAAKAKAKQLNAAATASLKLPAASAPTLNSNNEGCSSCGGGRGRGIFGRR